MIKYLFPVREPFNAFSHFIGAIISAAWLVVLLQFSSGDPVSYQISFFVYGVTVILMFLSSAIYHSVNVSFVVEERFRLFDHIMIYLVTAGTYTPICVIVLEDEWRIGMLIGIWSFGLLGTLKKFFWLNAPRWFSTVLYLIMGWLSVLIFPQMWRLLPHGFSYWIAIGGVFYTVGAIIYIFQKPDPLPERFGFHEIWHLFVMGGAFSHFWAIFNYLPGY